VKLGVVMEAFADRPLADALDWLRAAAPEVDELEIIAGGYGPTGHCDRAALLADEAARSAWMSEIESRGFTVGALNAWGNPLHPDPEVAAAQDRDLRETIRLAALLGVDRVVAMPGCPGSGPHDRGAPHFAGGAWLPDFEHVSEWQWDAVVLAYWSELSEFALGEAPGLRICLELHPGTCVHNVETFDRLSAVGSNIAANIDPSHFFWQQMDAFAIVAHLAGRIGHAHAKDVTFNEEALGLNGLLDRRWPSPPEAMPWNFATVGDGHDSAWWQEFVTRLEDAGARSISIEHEDPFVSPESGVPAAARLLGAGGQE
jgi:sugar phosphate isomerase/epimerase